jgi:serine phosphatase RsbU (regulator of sigma subunit)
VIERARQSNEEIDAEQLVDQLIAGVRAFTAGAPQSDDITAMVVRYRTGT